MQRVLSIKLWHVEPSTAKAAPKWHKLTCHCENIPLALNSRFAEARRMWQKWHYALRWMCQASESSCRVNYIYFGYKTQRFLIHKFYDAQVFCVKWYNTYTPIHIYKHGETFYRHSKVSYLFFFKRQNGSRECYLILARNYCPHKILFTIQNRISEIGFYFLPFFFLIPSSLWTEGELVQRLVQVVKCLECFLYALTCGIQ